jgi:hypothetical protein
MHANVDVSFHNLFTLSYNLWYGVSMADGKFLCLRFLTRAQLFSLDCHISAKLYNYPRSVSSFEVK